jgi:tRNA 2-selenouridine synthase
MTMQGRMPFPHDPVGLDALDQYDTLIDARSPAEFAEDAIPGAINCPVLDDEERRIVGTLYKQVGAFEARRVGAAMVAANLARHLRGPLADKPSDWRPLVYCWRGGLRSGSMVTWLRMVGWSAVQLRGGYKTWRSQVIERIDTLAPRLPLRVLCGPTGSAKTAILQAAARAGAQVLDLEGLAAHKGSVLGAMPGVEQPSQKAFETRLAQALAGFDLARPVFVEAESRKIGRIALPNALVERLRQSPASRWRPRWPRGWSTCCATTPTWGPTARPWPRPWAGCTACWPTRPWRAGRPGPAPASWPRCSRP